MRREELTPYFERVRPLPEVAVRVLALADDEATNVAHLARLLQRDPLLHAACLRVANSPLMGLRQKVESVERAVALLGRRAIVKLVVTACAGDTLRGGTQGYLLQTADLFRHGLAAAAASELVARRLGAENPGLLYSACLLQDIGKIVLDAWVAEQGASLHHLVEDEVPFPEAERLCFGVDHATVGGWLAESWGFPEPLVEAIAHHHHPERASDPTPARVVQLCDLLCLMEGIGCGADGLAYAAPAALLDHLGLDHRELGELALALAERLPEVEAVVAEVVPA